MRRTTRTATDARVQKEIADGMFLGAVVLAGTPNELVFHETYGERGSGKPMQKDSLFDVASISKPKSALPVSSSVQSDGKATCQQRSSAKRLFTTDKRPSRYASPVIDEPDGVIIN